MNILQPILEKHFKSENVKSLNCSPGGKNLSVSAPECQVTVLGSHYVLKSVHGNNHMVDKNCHTLLLKTNERRILRQNRIVADARADKMRRKQWPSSSQINLSDKKMVCTDFQPEHATESVLMFQVQYPNKGVWPSCIDSIASEVLISDFSVK